ncbi:O-acyltransferase [Macleaya cordata]|uniref:O-acyltransferase n=1 Tax=Macleaya cordata TaxID=56857 RepID=A0A200PS01_MACCD|nr:O-acyltransferase [Macleaya cordata]
MDIHIDDQGVRSRMKTLKAIVTNKRCSSSSSRREEGSRENNNETNIIVNGGHGTKTTINPDVIKAGLANSLVKHPRFSSLQVPSKGVEMKWVRTEVNLENHVIVPDLDANMDSPDKFVEDYISNITKNPIDMSKPLWELHLLNLKTAEAEAVGVLRAHHSLGDGTSLMSLLLACTRKTADPNALPTVPVMTKRSVCSKSSNRFWQIFVAIWTVFQLVRNTIVDILMFIATSIFLKDTETPLKGAPGVEFTTKRFVHRIVSLDDIKLVKNAMNMTINDVVLGVTAAGLSRYLNRRYGEGKKDEEATEEKNNLPKDIRLRSNILVNIRPSKGIQASAKMMEKHKIDANWGNLLGYVLLPFTIALRNNPLDYVREAKATIDRKKNSYEALYTFLISEPILKFFGIKAAAALTHNIITHTTMSFSNLIGPQEEISFYGHPIAYLAPSTYGLPHAFIINYQSYVNKMIIVLAVDQDAVPDPHQLCDDLEESLKLIKDAVVAKC